MRNVFLFFNMLPNMCYFELHPVIYVCTDLNTKWQIPKLIHREFNEMLPQLVTDKNTGCQFLFEINWDKLSILMVTKNGLKRCFDISRQPRSPLRHPAPNDMIKKDTENGT